MNNFQPLHQPESSMPSPKSTTTAPMQYTSMPQTHPGFGYGNRWYDDATRIMAMPPQMYPMQYGGKGNQIAMMMMMQQQQQAQQQQAQMQQLKQQEEENKRIQQELKHSDTR